MLNSEIAEKIKNGLSDQQVLELQQAHGKNTLPAEKLRSGWKIYFEQFKSPLIYIILVAALISFFSKELTDFFIIMAVVLLDTILGFIQEYQAQRTYTALRGLLRPTATVIRDGKREDIDLAELVPGDIVLLASGDKVPADGTLLESTKLIIDEAILTGESEPIQKDSGEEKNQVYMGTTVLGGRAALEVRSTGIKTELGKIADSLREAVDQETPLQIRLKTFSKTLTFIVVGFTLLIFIAGLLMKHPILGMLRTSIILAIAAVPEGLLIAVTVILVLGMKKILKRQALVKKMLAVETLGSVTTICTDKTGTLTEGKMRVTRFEFSDEKHAIQTMVLCNNLEGPVDLALWEFAKQNGNPQDVVDHSDRHSEELFSSESKFMVTETSFEKHSHFFIKGAPEIVLSMCDHPEKSVIMKIIDQWAAEGLRLIGLAYRSGGQLEDHTGYTWVGLVGMDDPVREGVVESIALAQHAGIKIKMITGDYRITAERIARNIGIFKDEDLLLDGEDLSHLSDEELSGKVEQTSVFARIRPQDKLRIIKALQANKEITAMIGDGVNDAPALKHSNIGVVVGSATDVAKETADVILLDNNFKTIVAAVEEGRTVFENIRKVVAYTLSNSFAEVLTIFIAMLLKWAAPLTVAQILWIHIICDGPSDIVLGFEPKEPGIMDETPKSTREPILTRVGLFLIGAISITSTICALLIFGYYSSVLNDVARGQTMVFASFAVNSIVYIFAYRSLRFSMLKTPPLRENKPLIWAVAGGFAVIALAFVVPFIREGLGIVLLYWWEFIIVIGIAILLLGIVEIAKFASRKMHKVDHH